MSGFTVGSLAAYVIENENKIYSAAILGAETIKNGGITVQAGIKSSEQINLLANTAPFQADGGCAFAASGSTTFTQRQLSVSKLKWQDVFCPDDLEAKYTSKKLTAGSNYETLPFEQEIMDLVVSNINAQMEQAIWQGTNINGQFTGFQSALSASIAAGGATAVLAAKSGSIVISGSVTSANVLDVLNSVVNTIPDTVYGKPDVLLYVATDVAKAYQQALAGGAIGANGWNNQLNVGEKPFNFNGIEIVWCPGMSSSKIVAAQKSNLFFGTGLLSDYNEVKVLDMANIDGSQNYRIVMRYTGGTQFGIGQDIVYYGAY